MNKNLIKQILKFLVVGGTAFVIDYGIFALLTQTPIDCHYLIAQVISFTISLIFNYIASIKWVFDAKKQTKKEAITFVVLSVIGLVINSILLYIGVDLIHIHELIVKLFATAVVMVYNFVTRKLIIEKHN
ncbi:MAG: GtrA family protein [Bacilli bacterium]|nr:GtrA family protein [Bacilli bacterium]